MKHITIALFMIIAAAMSAHAVCPSGWEEVPLEHMTLTSENACPTGTVSYYHIDAQCNANVF